jgi:hypothetical protein
MSTIVTRAGKGSPLTWNEVDNNFTNLNTDKLQSGNTAAALTITSATINGGTITGTALNGSLGATTPSTAVVTSLTDSGLTSGRVTYASTGGLLADSANLTFNGTTLSTVGLTTTGNTILGNASTDTLNVGNGGLVKDASGNVGIGTASPVSRLDVEQANAKSSTASWQFNVGDLTSQATGVGGGITFSGYKTATSATAYFAGIDAYKENSTAGNAAGALRFHTQVSGGSGLVERMRIDASGNLLVGATSAPSSTVAGVLLTKPALGVSCDFSCGTTTATVRPLRFMNGNGYVGAIATNSSITAFETSSDARLKNDLGVAVDTSVIDNVVVHDFSWKVDNLVDRGVFAQEAHLIKPLAVSIGNDELDDSGRLNNPWGVDYSKFVPDLIVHAQQLKKLVQEQQAMIDELKAKVAALEAA